MPDYRDELSAAHARIAELEDKIRALETDDGPSSAARRFPDLESAVEAARPAADGPRILRRITWITYLSILFPLGSIVCTATHQPGLGTAFSIGFIAMSGYILFLRWKLKSGKLRLAAAEERLGEAQKVAALEAKLAAATKAQRVRVGEEPDEVEEAAASEAARRL